MQSRTTTLQTKTILIIIDDVLSALIRKGEITDRYYNPGELFDDVHILMTNDDRPDRAHVQRMVGNAILYVHHLPPLSFKRTLGWQRSLTRSWLDLGLNIARQVRPLIVRTYGNCLGGFLGAHIKKQLGIPLVVSLHTDPDESQRGRTPWWPPSSLTRRVRLERRKTLERVALTAADCVIAVCEPYGEYAIRYGAHRVQVIPNVLNPDHLHRKTSYDLHSPPRIVSVGRQISGKNPENLIRAVADLPVVLTLVGDGELHEHLRQVATHSGALDRVTFLRAVGNDELCETLSDFDIFAVHCSYSGIPKAVIEPLLVGLPVVINRERPRTPELDGDWVLAVHDTRLGYRQALLDLIQQHQVRAALGARGYDYAHRHFSPQKVEQQLVNLYRELVPNL
ncbi:glycosyltransferase [archaeon]|nr:MAG: glycosyltransferase [archaeon]